MKLQLVPRKLHHLIPLVEVWGLGDDGFRDEQIEYASIAELKKVVGSLPDETMEVLNAWLEDEMEIERLSEEYIKFTCYLMAYEYADIILHNRALI